VIVRQLQQPPGHELAFVQQDHDRRHALQPASFKWLAGDGAAGVATVTLPTVCRTVQQRVMLVDVESLVEGVVWGQGMAAGAASNSSGATGHPQSE
jgi:hypothetical protein